MAHLPTVFEKAPGLPSEHQRGLYYLRDTLDIHIVSVVCRNGLADDNGPAGLRFNLPYPDNVDDVPVLVTERRRNACKDIFRVIHLAVPGKLIPYSRIGDNPTGLQLQQFTGDHPGTSIFFPRVSR